ncbi:hypothetical protein H0H81_000449 [Sphagnurus paluster]|uniref:F-box domain-containing protein n=1 Tax=Sphagnurus paluster TaxID=117069 RepID=A0A9P7KIX2_9AGAR|nr:hypothetical protein H0H81_000449 [Sphagnurus paluster]
MHSIMVLNGPINEKDWERLIFYAKRVRHLVFTDNKIHSSVYFRLLQWSKHAPLLPNVQSIESMPRESGILCVLSPSLRRVSIVPDDTSELFPAVWACLEALVDAAPQLRTLHVQTTLTEASLSSFSRMSDLRELSLICPGIHDLRFVHKLSSLEHLNSLRITFDKSSTISSPLRPPKSPAFPALTNLDLSIPPLQISQVLSIFNNHFLERLEIRAATSAMTRAHEQIDPDMWARGLRGIPTMFPHLKHLTLGYYGDQYGDILASGLFPLFEPLLELRKIETIRLEFPWLLFTDDEFKKIALAWPELTTLRFAGSNGMPVATIAALESFAINCPKIVGLSLAFDARVLPPTTVDDAPVSFSRVRTFDTQESPIESPLSVARHLDRIFPHIKTIQSARNGGLWAEVGDLLRVLKAVRTDQKARDLVLMKRLRSSRRMSTLD